MSQVRLRVFQNKPHLLRVFTDASGNCGDTVPVVIDEDRKISDAVRQKIAIRLGAPETVFVNDIATADISIMHLQGEVDFAGTPALGAAWLLATLRDEPITVMKGRKSDITTWQENGLTWVQTELASMPPWHHKQLDNPETVEHLTVEAMKTTEHTMVWAWIDEAKGLIRARTFASDWDIPEAEGNGSGSMILAAQLKRSIEIKHGKGSVTFAKPGGNDQAAIGGRVVEDG